MKISEIEDWIEAYGPAGSGEIDENTAVYVEHGHADLEFDLELEEHDGKKFVLIVPK
jgi:hypothetical protein